MPASIELGQQLSVCLQVVGEHGPCHVEVIDHRVEGQGLQSQLAIAAGRRIDHQFHERRLPRHNSPTIGGRSPTRKGNTPMPQTIAGTSTMVWSGRLPMAPSLRVLMETRYTLASWAMPCTTS